VPLDPLHCGRTVSFVFLGYLAVGQMRSFLMTVLRLAKISLAVLDSQLLALFAAFLMASGRGVAGACRSTLMTPKVAVCAPLQGTYATSSVVLMRGNLPAESREVRCGQGWQTSRQRARVSSHRWCLQEMTKALGGASLDMDYYRRVFDVIFVLSATASSLTLVLMSRFRRTKLGKLDEDDDGGVSLSPRAGATGGGEEWGEGEGSRPWLRRVASRPEEELV
jgi:hypothetical protein